MFGLTVCDYILFSEEAGYVLDELSNTPQHETTVGITMIIKKSNTNGYARLRSPIRCDITYV